MPTIAFRTTAEHRQVVDVVTREGELVSYPLTRAGLVDASCRLLARSELAMQTAEHCTVDIN